MTEIKDVYYNSWFDKTAPKQYWIDIDRISADIGQELEKVGITVFQCKEKFGECRVYVSLLVKNIKAYRDIYFKFKDMYPQYWNQSIKCGADWPELLCDDEIEYQKYANQMKKDEEDYNERI